MKAIFLTPLFLLLACEVSDDQGDPNELPQVEDTGAFTIPGGDQGVDMVTVQVWGPDLVGIASDVLIRFEGETIRDMHCESWGFCGVMYAEHGEYEITVTVGEDVQNKTIMLDDEDAVEIDPDDWEVAGSDPWSEEMVEFFFTSDA